MTLETFAYPFLFLAIYFEAFLLVTLLSSPARASRTRSSTSAYTPKVAMVVPCYNEGSTVRDTARSLLALSYPHDKLSIVLVNDGSTDNTAEIMEEFSHEPRITIIHQANGGKHAALNAGIAASEDAELIGCLDADSFVEEGALLEVVSVFENRPEVGAVTAAMSVHKPSNFVEHMQNAEYILGIALRHILASVNGLHVTPGPFSLYRMSTLRELGGFRKGHNTEDMEMALRIQRAGYHIESAHTARVFTTVPRSVPALVKQRTRWTSGFLRNVLYDYRDLVGNPRYGTLGMLVLPLGFFAIGGGVVLFFLAIYQLVTSTIRTLYTVSGIPLEYTLSTVLPRLSFGEWFYVPITLFLLLAVTAAIGSVLFIIVGRNISKTPAKLVAGVLGYILVYGLIAPFWLIRSVADVATNTRRSWR